jgi:hypothetical protein
MDCLLEGFFLGTMVNAQSITHGHGVFIVLLTVPITIKLQFGLPSRFADHKDMC